ncbi:class I SAM-dependent methyltransferase [Enterovirga sp. CN4-39]|uniref:class I SAM-dependent methyltransferase n=1 Tax=Enterovirga sp. CN4-39 TaxID=3400910 RepID=UPI003C0E5D43
MSAIPTRLFEMVSQEAFHWGAAAAAGYHEPAEGHMDAQWAWLLTTFFDEHRFDLSNAVDFAAGFGRNTLKLLNAGAGQVTAVDVNPDCIAALKTKLPSDRVVVVQNSGADLSALESGTYTFLYSFDAMVHFDLEIVIAYLPEFARVLRSGGCALIHHSNYSGNPGGDFRENPHWRNFMTAGIFKHVAVRSGFEVVEQRIFAWGEPDIDCITVMRKM